MTKQIKSFWIAQYNDDREVLHLGQKMSDVYNNFKIDTDLIPNFLVGKKHAQNYKIDYFIKIAEGLITDDEEPEDQIKNSLLLYELPKTSKDAEFKLIHKPLYKEWHIHIDSYFKDKIDTFKTVPLYFTLKDNPNHLIRTVVLSQGDIAVGRMVLKFKTVYEEDLNNISVLTTKQFRDYSIHE